MLIIAHDETVVGLDCCDGQCHEPEVHSEELAPRHRLHVPC